jgi:Domain of unknown function (DUF4440)
MHLRGFAVVTTAAVTMAMLLLVPAHAQQSHWASADDKTAKYIIDMEGKWAEGVCVDNGVVADLLADDFQGTSTSGARFTKADELKDEKSTRTAHDCGVDEAKVHFFGDNLALVYGREHAVGKDKSQPNAKVCQVWTDTWLKRGDKWQIIASQDNRVTCK